MSERYLFPAVFAALRSAAARSGASHRRCEHRLCDAGSPGKPPQATQGLSVRYLFPAVFAALGSAAARRRWRPEQAAAASGRAMYPVSNQERAPWPPGSRRGSTLRPPAPGAARSCPRRLSGSPTPLDDVRRGLGDAPKGPITHGGLGTRRPWRRPGASQSLGLSGSSTAPCDEAGGAPRRAMLGDRSPGGLVAQEARRHVPGRSLPAMAGPVGGGLAEPRRIAEPLLARPQCGRIVRLGGSAGLSP